MTETSLIVLLMVTNAFWAWQVQRLVSKLMSRTYLEFREGELAEKNLEAKMQRDKLKPDQFMDETEMGAVTEIMQ